MTHVSKAEFRMWMALLMISITGLGGGKWNWLFMTAWTLIASCHATSFFKEVKEVWRSK